MEEISIDKLVEDLKRLATSNNDTNDIDNSNIGELLDSLIDISKTTKGIGDIDMNDIFLILLKNNSREIISKTSKAVAEIAQTEKGREKCTNLELVVSLLDLMRNDHIDILIQTSRALGNICYENDNGRKIITERNGLERILSVLQTAADLKYTESANSLRNVASGLLLNFLVDQPSVQKKALEEQVVTVICNILEIDGLIGEKSVIHALLTLGIFNDIGMIFIDDRLIKAVVNILMSNTSSELSEICLELLQGQAEDDKVKFLLGKSGVCELLLNLLEKHEPRSTDEETRSVLKVACNLIVLILTGDDSMNVLYDNSNGIVYKKLVEWLDSHDEDLQVTAVLAMGNFARADSHCKLMVVEGVHKKLLKLLGGSGIKNGDIGFQLAVLSALRNLVIPADNKSIILNDGLIETLNPVLDISTSPIVFKLLGTLRIVIQGQREAAVSLGIRDDLVKKSVEWCTTEDHPGVQGEANRLLAWLINNSRDREVALKVIKHGGVEHLIKMMTSSHAVMQNEALISLTILSTICLKETEEYFLKAEIGQTITKFFKESANNIDIHIVHNAVSLVESMIKSDLLKEHLREIDLATTWDHLIISRELDTNLKERTNTLKTSIGHE